MDTTAHALDLLAANRYVVLATADEGGSPWATPVWFATDDARNLYWVSSPETRHSRNIAARPQIGIAIFDSTQAPGTGKGIYLSAVAAPVSKDELEAGIAIFTEAGLAVGLSAWSVDDVQPPAKHRLYRATAVERFVLDDHDERVAVP